jgi:phage terminase small subunit
LLKDSNEIDTSNVKSIRINDGEAVVEMYDKQKAMKELLNRLPNADDTSDKPKTVVIDNIKEDQPDD